MASTRGEAYARRQRAEGRAKRTLWLNPEEFEAAKQARDRLHGAGAEIACRLHGYLGLGSLA